MRILYATDGSAPARAGESLITALFDRTVEVEVFTVTPEPTYDLIAPVGLPESVTLGAPDLNADQIARATADRLAGDGFATWAATSSGDPAREILDRIEAGGIELVVLGASHSTWMGTLLLGRVSMHVLHHAPCSVLLSHRAPTGSGRILIGADGSEGSRASIAAATSVLDRGRCSVHVATVATYPWVLATTHPVAPFPGQITDAKRLERERIEHALAAAQRAVAEVKGAGFEVSDATVLEGSAGSQLLKEADNLDADLVVVGSRGRGGLSRAALGSMSDQIARHASAALVGRVS
jgi:nucleotide-binding universal stress UspA family protein